MPKSNCKCPPFDCKNRVDEHLSGDATAGNELHEVFVPLVRAIVSRILGYQRSFDWDDTCQTVFLRLFSKLSQWRREGRFCSYVGVIAARVAIDVRREIGPTNDPDVDPWIPDPAKVIDLMDCIEANLAKFRPEWRKVVELKENGLTHEQIAQELDITRRSVQGWLVQIRERLLPCLED